MDEERKIEQRATTIGYPSRFPLAAGRSVTVPVFTVEERVYALPADRVRFRITYEDVFGNVFMEPSDGSMGHEWFSGIPDEEMFELRYR